MSDSALIVEDSNLLASGSPRASRDGARGGMNTGDDTGKKKLAEEIIKRQKRLEHLRTAQEALWDDVDAYVTTRRARYNIGTAHGPSDDRPLGADIYDGTSSAAIRDFVDGWQSQSANALVKWWAGRYRNKMVREMYDAKRWMDEVEESLSFEMANSNFYEQINQAYGDGTSHGTATMVGPEWDAQKQKFYCLERHPREIFYATDWRGEVDLWHRKFPITGRQILQTFGSDSLTEKFRKQCEKNPYRHHTCIHAIFKREERDITSPLRIDMPWASVYVLEKEKVVLDEGGYTEMDLPDTWRWNASATYPYGTSPAIDAIMDIMGTNSATRSLLYAAQLAVRPPIIQTANLSDEDVDITPDGRILIGNPTTDKVQAFQYPTQFQIGVEQINELRGELRDRFKANIFQLQAELGGKITAFQANLVQGEKASMLIPITTRASSQLLIPKVNKFFYAAAKQGRIPAPPPSIMQFSGTAVDIQMMGPMAVSAKRFLSQQPITAFLAFMGEIDKVAPNVGQAIAKTINPDELRKKITDGDGTPEGIFFTDEQIAMMRKMEAELMAQQRKQDALGNLADAYNKAKDSPQPGSPAKQLTEGTP